MGVLNDLKKLFFGASSVSKSAANKTKDYIKEEGGEMIDKTSQFVKEEGKELIDKTKEFGQDAIEMIKEKTSG